MPKPYQIQDPYFHRAKEEGYRARSAYKLKEIDLHFGLMKKGFKVLDLGAAPGSFMQVILEKVGPEGLVVGVDLQAIDSFDRPQAITMQGDIYEMEALIQVLRQQLHIESFDVVTSDLAPKTSGIRDLDQGLSAELTEQAFLIAKEVLKKGGSFVGKVFQGEDLAPLVAKVKKSFSNVKVFKPKACRDRSFETYIVAMGFRG